MHDDLTRKAVKLLLGQDGVPLAEVSDKAVTLVLEALELAEIQPIKRHVFGQTLRLSQVAIEPPPITSPAVNRYFG